jgi:hypothetical protein
VRCSVSVDAEKSEICRALAAYLCMAALVFASGDNWPVITIGFTFRFSQLLVFLAAILLLPTIFRRGVLTFPGISWASAWVFWSVLTLPLSLFFARSAGYTVWLMSNVLIIFVFVQAFRTSNEAYLLLRIYLWSFILLSCFGALQFVLGIMGFSLLTTLWWIPEVLPRVNGLSYEPSYYATYLLPGWVSAAYLLESRCALLSRSLLRWTAFCTTGALLLSTSRMGWLLMIAWVVFRLVRRWLLMAAGSGASRRALGWTSASALCFFALMATPLGSKAAKAASDALGSVAFLLSGVGLFGAAAHSVEQRFQEFLSTWNAFVNNPWIGTGMGAVSVEVGAQAGNAIVTIADARANEGMSILLELLASIGIVGMVLVAGFVLAVLHSAVVGARNSDHQHRQLFWALGWGIVWMLVILQFNQNFLRVYLWMDVAVFVVALSVLGRRASPSYREAGCVPGAVNDAQSKGLMVGVLGNEQ